MTHSAGQGSRATFAAIGASVRPRSRGLDMRTQRTATAPVMTRWPSRVHHPSEGVQHARPGPVGEAFTPLAGRFEVVDLHEGVVVADIADAGVVQAAGQPLPSVEVDL